MRLREFLESLGLHSDECTYEDNPILDLEMYMLYKHYAFRYPIIKVEVDMVNSQIISHVGKERIDDQGEIVK